MNSPKATEENQQNHKKLRQKHNSRFGTGLSQTGPRFSFLTVVIKDNFIYISIIFLISLSESVIKTESQRKRLNRFKRFNFVDSDNTFHITIFKTFNAALSSCQTNLPCALHSEVWSCVSMGISSKSNILHQRDFELWDSHDLPNFPPLYPINCEEFCFFLFRLLGFHLLQL